MFFFNWKHLFYFLRENFFMFDECFSFSSMKRTFNFWDANYDQTAFFYIFKFFIPLNIYFLIVFIFENIWDEIKAVEMCLSSSSFKWEVLFEICSLKNVLLEFYQHHQQKARHYNIFDNLWRLICLEKSIIQKKKKRKIAYSIISWNVITFQLFIYFPRSYKLCDFVSE